MTKNKAKNEKIKRKYFDWLIGAEGFSDLTIDAIEKALWKYEEFTKDTDYREFNDMKMLFLQKHNFYFEC